MACRFCTIDHDGGLHGDRCVGEWCFDEEDDLAHRARGRVSLWYDFDYDEWSVLVLIDDGNTKRGQLPSCAQFKVDICPFCGRKLQSQRWIWTIEPKCRAPKDRVYAEDDELSGCTDVRYLKKTYSRDEMQALMDVGWHVMRHLATEYEVLYDLDVDRIVGHPNISDASFMYGSCLAHEEVSLEEVWGADVEEQDE